MAHYRDDRMRSAVGRAAAEFIARESNGRSLITVTRVEPREGGNAVTIFVSVMPETGTEAALDFLKRRERDFKDFLKTKVRARDLPAATFLPDPGMGSVDGSPAA